ncbi:His-Xaa-Ser system radical SAM maturase HxsC [Myroides odoratimimus]|uniref:His-Xaa-Ser system radical SAM maturase HxsC n=1 Tax=Myroides odoratimimus TaxID=76832 RepID=UPI0025754CB9|nr:His-Xaa-Ser system radical SAM maturase HxsC [Myroides odoratimimus]MDM1530892.1 His-Xaa-Ser system radical SAM maturase HxsC [Myroides odoratimimus]
MILKTRGKCIIENFDYTVGKVVFNEANLDVNSFYVSKDDYVPKKNNFLGVLTMDASLANEKTICNNIQQIDHLEEGDVILVNGKGLITTMYRVNSVHNTLMVTERCNSNCLMCSQPPKDKEDIYLLHEIHKKVIPLIPKDCFELGISGGEPTLMGNLFIDLLKTLKENLPNTHIHVLTNGRTFAWNNLVEKISELQYDKVMYGIPLYSDYYKMHDYIVQAKDAFHQTILGIHNLARYDLRIEIRIVLHKLSVERLLELSKYIYKNMPYVEHVAFMGLEYIGYTPHNIEKLWIDPYDYKDVLSDSVNYLGNKGIRTSIYNSTLCTLNYDSWHYSRKSISDWKNEYLEECNNCRMLEECGGLFRWNLKKHSNYIKPFSEKIENIYL